MTSCTRHSEENVGDAENDIMLGIVIPKFSETSPCAMVRKNTPVSSGTRDTNVHLLVMTGGWMIMGTYTTQGPGNHLDVGMRECTTQGETMIMVVRAQAATDLTRTGAAVITTVITLGGSPLKDNHQAPQPKGVTQMHRQHTPPRRKTALTLLTKTSTIRNQLRLTSMYQK